MTEQMAWQQETLAYCSERSINVHCALMEAYRQRQPGQKDRQNDRMTCTETYAHNQSARTQ